MIKRRVFSSFHFLPKEKTNKETLVCVKYIRNGAFLGLSGRRGRARRLRSPGSRSRAGTCTGGRWGRAGVSSLTSDGTCRSLARLGRAAGDSRGPRCVALRGASATERGEPGWGAPGAQEAGAGTAEAGKHPGRLPRRKEAGRRGVGAAGIATAGRIGLHRGGSVTIAQTGRPTGLTREEGSSRPGAIH